MTDSKRISITSLLNEDSQQRKPAALLSTRHHEYSTSDITVRRISRTPSTVDVSPSPTMSQSSISSSTSSLMGRAPHHRPRSNSNESCTTTGSTTRHSHMPYDTNQRTRRPGTRKFRPSYEVEESYFIWFHRLDLNLDWSQVNARFNYYFPRQRSGCQGFQCKFYRFLQENGLPSVRERAKDPNAPRTYALRTWKPEIWYPWMQPGATELPRRHRPEQS